MPSAQHFFKICIKCEVIGPAATGDHKTHSFYIRIVRNTWEIKRLYGNKLPSRANCRVCLNKLSICTLLPWELAKSRHIICDKKWIWKGYNIYSWEYFNHFSVYFRLHSTRRFFLCFPQSLGLRFKSPWKRSLNIYLCRLGRH